MTNPINPIPDILDPVPAPTLGSIKFMSLTRPQAILAIARASLVVTKRKNKELNIESRSNITASILCNRVELFLKSFRIRISRRIRTSRNTGYLRKLCKSFLDYNPPTTPIKRSLLLISSEILTHALRHPNITIDENWHNCRTKFNNLSKRTPIETPPPLKKTLRPRQGDVSILFWNANGQHTKEHKRTLLLETSRDLKLDIICLVETKTASPSSPAPGFHIISSRPALTGSTSREIAGGICVGKIPSSDLTGRSTLIFTGYIEATATSFTSSHFTFTLITCYIPPNHSSTLRGRFTDTEFLNQLRELYDRPLMFVADANTDIITWTGRGKKTIEAMLEDGWILLSSPSQPTRGDRCIDIVLTRNFSYKCSLNVVPLSANDHQGLHVHISTKHKRPLPNTCSRHTAIRFAKCLTDVEHAHYSIAVSALFEARLPTPAHSHGPPPESLEPLEPQAPLLQPAPRFPIPQEPNACFSTIINAVNNFAAAEREQPYISSDNLYRELKCNLRKVYVGMLISRHLKSHRQLRNVYKGIKAAKRNVDHIAAKIRQRHTSRDAANAFTLASHKASTNVIIRRIERAFNPNHAFLNVAELSPEQASRHNQFWTERWSQPFLLPPDRHQTVLLNLNPPPGVVTPHTFSITHFPDGSPWLTDTEEVDKAVMSLSNHRAPGPSGIPVDLFKLTQDFHEDLVEVFNAIITSQESIPTFSHCRLILLHKSGPTTEPKNYRPINLTEAGFRILESLIRNRLKAWGESVLHQDQYGFRHKQSTMSALFRIVTALHAAIASGSPLHICFLDAVKAFDRVPHAAILETLQSYGLCAPSCRLINSIISDHSSIIANPEDPASGLHIPVNCGVLQGGICSPFLHGTFSNPILEDKQFTSDQAVFADDRTTWDGDATNLQSSLDRLETWSSTRNLLHDGNEVITVNAPPPQLKIHDKPIPCVSSAKCLGLQIHDTGTIERANLIPQASFRTLKIIITWGHAKLQSPFTVLKTVINRYMIPATTYGSALFTENVGPSLDKFLYRILRKATSSHNSTNTTLLLESTGTIRPTVKIQREIISVLSRLLDNSSSHVIQAVRTQFNLGLPFATKTRKLLESLSDFPPCGSPLLSLLDDILHDLDADAPLPNVQPDRLPFTPQPPSTTHFLAFTDGSTSDTRESGCSTIILVGTSSITSSFYLPDIHENNAAEIKAIDLLLDQIINLKSTPAFQHLDSGTIVTDSLNTANALHGTSLLQDPTFITILHCIRKKLRTHKISLTIKWVKAHDDTRSSPYNDLADQWSSHSIPSRTPFTCTVPIQEQFIIDATRPIDWHDSELPPQTLAKKVDRFRAIADNAILVTEDERYRSTLLRYIHPHHINFPGSKPTLLSSASIPGAHWLLHLRRDPCQHFADYQDLQHLNASCPLCNSDHLPTHSHLLQHCSFSKLSLRDKRRCHNTRQYILSLHSPPSDAPLSGADLQHFLGHLTSSAWPDNSIANAVVKHTSRLFKILHARRCARTTDPEAPEPPTTDSEDEQPDDTGDQGQGQNSIIPYHTGPAARQIILNRLEDCRSVTEFDACVNHYGKQLAVLTKWATKQKRPFFRPMFFRQWLARIEEYLTIFNLPTHHLRFQAYLRYEAQPDRAYHNPVPTRSWLPRMTKICNLLNTNLLRFTPAELSAASRPNRLSRKSRGKRAAHHRTVSCPSWAHHLNWSLQKSTPLVEAWFASPTSTQQRQLIGPAWPSSWPMTTTITTRTKIHPDNYVRQTLSQSKEGHSLLFLYDLIREALHFGELSSSPPLPPISAIAAQKRAQGISRFYIPYEAAALTLIFTPIQVLRDQGYSFHINPTRTDRPPSLTPFTPRLEVFTQVWFSFQLPESECITEAREWALSQMNSGRNQPHTSFPDIPPDIPGPPTDSESDGDLEFDDIVEPSTDSDSDSNQDDPPLPPPPSAPKRRRTTSTP